MDKNLINIDDLVRQKLGGGEEKERGGAWLQMRDLLDKEMPQAKAGGIFHWNRTLSYISVLLLAGSVAVGGYELSGRRQQGKDTQLTILFAKATGNNLYASASPDAGKEKYSGFGAAVAAVSSAEMAGAKSISQADDNDNINGAATVSSDAKGGNVRGIRSVINTAKAGKKDISAPVKGGNNLDDVPAAMPGTASGLANKHKAGNRHTSYPVTSVNTAAVAAGQKVPHSHKAATSTSATVQAVNTTGALTASVSNADDIADADKANTGSIAATAKQAKDDAVGTGATSFAAKHTHTGKHKATAQDNTVSMPQLALAGATPVGTDDNTAGSSAHGTHAARGRHSDNSASGIVPNAVGTVMDKDNDKKSANAARKHTAAKSAGTAHVKKSKSSGTRSNMPVAMRRQKHIEKITVQERYIKTTPFSGYYHMDTLAIEEVMIDAENEDELNAGMNNACIFNAAAMSSASVPALPATKKDAAKNKSGESSLQKLNMAFNDIKYKINAAQFAPGLTAGVNGTFFSPSSFKGFQFGFTGNFVFDDRWSLMGELKYFHRINNNFSIADNYNRYTENASGNYTVDSMQYTHSFSTLHSFELPVALRFTTGKLTLFGGGNFAYTLGINSGSSPLLADPNAALKTVSAIGVNNAPKYKDSDFDSRFGIGYMLGIAYQVTPNVSFDLRNVQTVWDNAGSAGGKSVSALLYKGPSLQLSVGYRLGSRKGNKD